jgi:hypothetical protein
VEKFLLVCSLAFLLSQSCRSVPSENSTAKVIADRDLYGSDFDLQEGEFHLTFNYGPGTGGDSSLGDLTPNSLDLARFLSERQIPAVFFLSGMEAEKNLEMVKAIANLPFMTVANGSYRPLKVLSDHGQILSSTVEDLVRTDAIIAPLLPSGTHKFFRPPFYAFTPFLNKHEAGAMTESPLPPSMDQIRQFRSSIKYLNLAQEGVLRSYIGPVRTDIGEPMEQSDWGEACREDGKKCIELYMQAMKSRGKGIVAFHDILPETRKMLIDLDFFEQVAAAGFRFVDMQRKRELLTAYSQGAFHRITPPEDQMHCSTNRSMLENYPGAVFANYTQSDAANNPGLWNFEILYFGEAEEIRIFFRSSDPTVPAIRLKLPPDHSLTKKNGETILQFARETAKSGMSELVVVVCGVDAQGNLQTLDRAYFPACLTGMSGALPVCY